MDATVQFLTQHGTIMLFLIVLAEQVGLPIPALPMLIAAGALVGTDQMNLATAVGVSILAALLGDQLWFELGRRLGRRSWAGSAESRSNRLSCVRRTEALLRPSRRSFADGRQVYSRLEYDCTTARRHCGSLECRSTSCTTALGRFSGQVPALVSAWCSATNSSWHSRWLQT